MQALKTLDRRTVLDMGRYLKVESHTVQLPDGRVLPDWPWIITPDYINVLVETATGQFLVFQQVKYGFPDGTLALIGGYIEPGETPLVAAQRELSEETGYQADEWVQLGSYLADPNRGIATGSLFLARHAVQVAQSHSDDLEEQQPLFLSRDELEQALDGGAFKVMAWSAGVAFGLRALDRAAGESTSEKAHA
jgi:ADP-ribose pyrophosphatase